MKTFRSIERKCPVNLVSSNMVDKDVQSMLWPLNLMQYIMFCPKYRIKNDYITTNSLISNFISMIGTLVFLFMYIHCTFTMDSISLGLPTFMHVSSYIDCFFYCSGFVMNFIIGIIRTKNNVQFVLTFQKVHRFLNNETSVSYFIIWNWIFGIVALSFYVIFFTAINIHINIPFYSVYVWYFLVIFDFNIVYATRVTKLLENKVVLWNIQVLNAREFEDIHRANYVKKVFQAYAEILECYNIHKVSCQQFILYHILEVVIHSLSYTQVAIETFKEGIIRNDLNQTLFISVGVLSWMIKDLMWQTILIHQCEKFYLVIRSVQDACALMLMSTCSDDDKKLCKNVLRLHRASFSKIRVCGLFYVDAALQLSLMSFLTNYIVVLLQFAFL